MRPGLAMTLRIRQPVLEKYLVAYQQDFPRRDQFRWVQLYVQGLLGKLPRKNIDTIARHFSAKGTGEDVGQALQNFIHQSPWDEQGPWRRYREHLRTTLGSQQGLFVFEEITFVKQGQHSVGVQRQFSQSLGEKVNCQIAVGVHYVSPLGHAPLALRLYLPRKWLEQPDRLIQAGVPEKYHQPLSKGGVALHLLDEIISEKFPGCHVQAAASFASNSEWKEGLACRGFDNQGQLNAEPLYSFYLPPGQELKRNGPLPHLQKGLPQARQGWDNLCRDYGLDHFEGRSWRGFHHHACLVMLAAGFHLTKK
jgi:SRSO17 transposase